MSFPYLYTQLLKKIINEFRALFFYTFMRKHVFKLSFGIIMHCLTNNKMICLFHGNKMFFTSLNFNDRFFESFFYSLWNRFNCMVYLFLVTFTLQREKSWLNLLFYPSVLIETSYDFLFIEMFRRLINFLSYILLIFLSFTHI